MSDTDTLREALEWYRDQLCEGYCEGFTPRICKALMDENPTGGDCGGCRAALALATLSKPEPAAVDGNDTPPSLNAPTFNDRAEERVCINGCLFLRADFAARRYTSPVPSGGANWDEAGHMADAIRDAALAVGKGVISFDKSRDMAQLVMTHLAKFRPSPSEAISPPDADPFDDCLGVHVEANMQRLKASSEPCPPDARAVVDRVEEIVRKTVANEAAGLRDASYKRGMEWVGDRIVEALRAKTSEIIAAPEKDA